MVQEILPVSTGMHWIPTASHPSQPTQKPRFCLLNSVSDVGGKQLFLPLALAQWALSLEDSSGKLTEETAK